MTTYRVPLLVNGRRREYVIDAQTPAVAKKKALRIGRDIARACVEPHRNHAGTSIPPTATCVLDGEPVPA